MSKDAKLSAIGQWQERSQRQDHRRNLSANHVGERGRDAAIGHVGHAHAGGLPDDESDEMQRGARAGGAVVGIRGCGLRAVDVFLQVDGGARGAHRQRNRIAAQVRHRDEIGQRVVGRLAHRVRVERNHRIGRHHQRIAVRRRSLQGLRRDHARSAGTRLDHHRSSQRFGESFGKNARQRIHAAAWWKAGNDAGLGECGCHAKWQQCEQWQ